MNQSTLTSDLRKLEKRRAELSADVTVAESAHEQAQDGLIAGTGGASDVTSAHTNLQVLQSALASLDEKIEAKKADIKAAQEADEAKARLTRIEQIKQEREVAISEFFSARNEAEANLQASAERLNNLREKTIRLAGEAQSLGVGLSTQLPTSSQTQFGTLVVQAEMLHADGLERERSALSRSLLSQAA